MGNLTSDGTTAYTYNAEGRPITAGGVQVFYDAFGRAVEWLNGSTYTQLVYTPTGQKLAFMNGSTLNQYFAPLVAGVQAVYNSSGLQYYRHADWLGSVRFISKPDGTVYGDQAYAPFGESYAVSGTGPYDFTGQTKDTVGVAYDFLFRQYSQVQSRWQVPDPAGLAAVDLTNPQTWNRYAYVGNNPLSNVDPLGLYLAEGCDDTPGGDCPWGWSGIWSIGSCWDCFGGGGGGGRGGGGNGGGGGGGGGSQQQPINFPNETLGLPNGFPTNPWGIWGAIIPTAQCGDITCPQIGSGLQPSASLGGGPIFTGQGLLNLLELGWTVGSEIFAATAQAAFVDPNMRLFGTHYCGLGGGGSLSSLNPEVDAACKAHDKCYKDIGAGSVINLTSYSAAVQACNQQLCNQVRQIGGLSAESIGSYFSYGPNACH